MRRIELTSHIRLIFWAAVAMLCVPGTAQVQAPSTVGPCLVFHIRGNVTTDPAIDTCRQLGGSAQAANLRGWVLAQLGYAFDQAERAQCGTLGCLGPAPVTIILYPDALANAGVQRRTDRLTLTVNTGLIDFIDAAARSFNSDMKNLQLGRPTRGGYGDWMASVLGLGGQRCVFQVAFPTPTVASADLPQEQAVASAAYQLVLAHELSHFRTPQFRCNYSGQDQLGLEMSCDRIAESSLLRVTNTTFTPVAAVAWMMAMEVYERLTGPLYHNFYMGGNAPPTFEGMFPARDWKARSRQIVQTWNAFCGTGARSAICPDGYGDVIRFADSLTQQPLPTPCSPDSAPHAQTSGGFCSALKQALSLAASKFASIKGVSYRSGDSQTTFLIPGFRSCTVQNDADSGDSNLFCSAPTAKYADLLQGYKSCLSDWAVEEHVDKSGRRHANFSHRGLRPVVSVWESNNGGVSTSVDEHE